MAVFTMNMIGVVDLIPPVISHLEDAQGNTVASLSVDENSAPGTVVGTVVADASAYSFAIVGGSSTFAISNTGQITVSNNSALDYETTTSLSFQVTASDYANNVSAALSVTVNILDVDDTPPVVTLYDQAQTSLFETENNVLVARFSATDAGSDLSSSIVLSGANTTNFEVAYNAPYMELRTSSSGLLGGGVSSDQNLTFTLSATDAFGNTGSTTCNLTVKSEPAFTGPTSVNVTENTTTTSTNVASYTLLRPTPVTWSLSGTDASDFTITSTGIVRFAANPDYELPSDSNQDRQYSLSVNASNVYGLASSNLIVNLQNDPSDDPLVYDLGQITSFPPQHGIAVYGGDFFWVRRQYYNNKYYIFPVWFDVSANSVSSGYPALSGNSQYTDYRPTGDSVVNFDAAWTVGGNGHLITRHKYQGDAYIARWNMSTSSGWSNHFHNYHPYTDPDGAVYNSHDGGLFMGSHLYTRNGYDWHKWTSNSTPYYPSTYINVNSQISWRARNDYIVFYALVGSYIYSLPTDAWSSTSSGQNTTTTSKDYLRVLNSSNFQVVGEAPIQYWPGNNTSQNNTGMAYDGSNIWICRGDELAKFTPPPSNNPTAQLVPTQ